MATDIKQGRVSLPSRTFGLARASTAKQVDSCDVQLDQIATYCKLNGLLDAIMLREPDATSGYKLDFRQRPMGAYLWNTLRKGDTLIVSKCDRLGRRFSDIFTTADKLWKRGVHVVILSMGGRMVDFSSTLDQGFFIMMAWVAAVERELISTRTKEALAYRRNAGLAHNQTNTLMKVTCVTETGTRKPVEEYNKMAGDRKLLELDREVVRQVIQCMQWRRRGATFSECRKLCEREFRKNDQRMWWDCKPGTKRIDRQLERTMYNLVKMYEDGDLPEDVAGAVAAFLPPLKRKSTRSGPQAKARPNAMPSEVEQATWTAEEWQAFFNANAAAINRVMTTANTAVFVET